jgi:16S rRNA (uracil1498-N3)-methyltransferase
VSSLLVRAGAAAQVLTEDLNELGLDAADVHHLARALRLRDGEQVVACDGAGQWRLCAWRPDGRGGVLEPTGPIETEPVPAWPTAVWLPALKGARAEWAVAKLTELGVDRIGLLACDHAAVRVDGDAAARALERWARVAREATCQSRRTRLPELLGPLTVAVAGDLGAVRCDLGADDSVDAEVAALLVGPEGGWSDAERSASPKAVGLGDTVLRTETAAVAAGITLSSLRRSRRHDHGVQA